MFSLVYTRDGRQVRHVLAAGDTVAGRAPVCDLVIDDPSISRRHARFRVHGPRCHLTELGGRNGTFINGKQIIEGELAAGDTVVLGRVALQVHWGAPDATAVIGAGEVLPDEPSTIFRPPPGAPAVPAAVDLDPRRLLELVRELAAQLVRWQSYDDALERIVRVVFATTPAERAFLVIADAAGAGQAPRLARTRNGAAMGEATLNRAAIDRALTRREATLATDATAGGAAGVRSIACVPMVSAGAVLGVIYADAASTTPLTGPDLRVLEALGVYASAVLAHAAAPAAQNE